MTLMLQETGKVLVAYRAPFAMSRPELFVFDPGTTLSAMVAQFPGLPPDFFQRGNITIGGHVIDRRYWSQVRPKPGQSVGLHYALGNGGRRGGGAGKAVLGLIIAVATILTAGAAAMGAFGGLLGSGFAAGTLGAKLLAGGISLIGSLAQAAISRPPAQKAASTKQDTLGGAASANGNVLSPGAPIPRVIGTRRVYPVLASQPMTLREGRDEIAEAIFVLAGPHKLEGMRAGDTAVEDVDDIQVEVREGWSDDNPIGLIQRYGVTKGSAVELSAPMVDGEDQSLLQNQANPEKSLPKWNATSGADGADEIHLNLTFPQGFTQSDGAAIRAAFRLRMRKSANDPWINLPELHFQSNDNREVRANIILKWAPDLETVPAVPAKEGWIAAYKLVTGQATPPSPDWNADGSFSSGAGNDYLCRSTEAFTNVRRVFFDRYTATFLLDASAIPKGAYEIQLQRSAAVTGSQFSTPDYTYGGNKRDLFWYIVSDGKAKLVRSRENIADQIYLVRSTSVFNQHPIKGGDHGPGLAIMAVRAKGRAIDNFSVEASGYVKDWDGAGWNTWTTTSLPAPHFHDILRGSLTPDPIDVEIIDNDSLVDWRQACIDLGYTCDLICEGDAIDDILSKVAGCGYAQPRMSETWGVIRDYDRSGEDPVQIFTHRNMRDLKMSKAFARLPDALRVAWPDGENLDVRNEVIVWRAGRENVPNPRIEEVTYDAFKDEPKAIQRGTFDLRQGEARSAFFSWTAPMEAIVCQRGDLVGINHPVIEISHDAARIVDVEIEGEDIVALVLDAPVAVYNEGDMHAVADMHAVRDMHLIGQKTSVSVRDADSVLTVPVLLTNPTGGHDRLVLADPLPVTLTDDGEPVIRSGNLAWVGRQGSEVLRLVITDIKPGRDFTATLTGVDEASDILFAA